MSGRIGRVLATAVLLIMPHVGHAFEWLYSNSTTSVVETPNPPLNSEAAEGQADHAACLTAIARAEARHGIPENLLLAIGLQEAGLKRDGVLTVWPWTINSQGVGSRFDTKRQAISYTQGLRRDGLRSFDVGCMQINMRWHGQHFDTLEDAYDPDQNADYAARFLKSLRNDADSWMSAAGNYHSKTPTHHAKYLGGIERNLKVATAKRDTFLALSKQRPLQTASLKSPTRDQPKKTVEINGYKNSFISRNTIQDAQSRQFKRLNKKRAYAESAATTRGVVEEDAQNKTERMTGAWWTSELSNSHSDYEKRTIYSTQSIEPVLPHLRDMTR